MEGLDVERIERRADILWNVDARECEGCHATAGPEIASDPTWFVDSEGHRAEDGSAYEVAIIRCPKCW